MAQYDSLVFGIKNKEGDIELHCIKQTTQNNPQIVRITLWDKEQDFAHTYFLEPEEAEKLSKFLTPDKVTDA
jgi:tRNA A37 threonylcarbamoyladenosine synthetase subunit TsaC/SUA5/YrdC